MLDLVLLVIFAWCILFGVALGAVRTLMTLSAFIGALFVIELGSPWLKLLQLYPEFLDVDRWLRRMLSPDIPVLRAVQSPVATGGRLNAFSVLHAAYLQVTLLSYAAAVGAGFLLALRSLETLRETEILRRSNSAGGVFLGIMLGVFAVLSVLRILPFVGWWMRWGWVGALVRKSAVFQLWGHWIALIHHGIFF